MNFIKNKTTHGVVLFNEMFICKRKYLFQIYYNCICTTGNFNYYLESDFNINIYVFWKPRL